MWRNESENTEQEKKGTWIISMSAVMHWNKAKAQRKSWKMKTEIPMKVISLVRAEGAEGLERVFFCYGKTRNRKAETLLIFISGMLLCIKNGLVLFLFSLVHSSLITFIICKVTWRSIFPVSHAFATPPRLNEWMKFLEKSDVDVVYAKQKKSETDFLSGLETTAGENVEKVW